MKEVEIVVSVGEALVYLGLLAVAGVSGVIYWLRNRVVVVVGDIRTNGDVARGVQKLAMAVRKKKGAEWINSDRLTHEAVHGWIDRGGNLDGEPGEIGYTLRGGRVKDVFYVSVSRDPDHDMKVARAPVFDRRTNSGLSEADRRVFSEALERKYRGKND